MKCTHEDAVAVLVACQFGTAGTWPAKKVAAKIAKLDEAVDVETAIADKRLKKLKDRILAAIEAEEAIDIAPPVGGDEEEEAEVAQPKKAATKKPAAKPAPVAEEEEEEDEADVPVKPKKPAAKPAAAAKAPKPEKAPGIPGVRETRSRPYLAGIVIKQAMAELGANGKPLGLKCGVTAEMRDQLDAAYPKPNPSESMFALRNAWAAARGVLTKGNEGDLEQSEEE